MAEMEAEEEGREESMVLERDGGGSLVPVGEIGKEAE
jgi:hypothetical protein